MKGNTVVVSNRLPVTADFQSALPPFLRPAIGGLEQTLDSILLGSGGGTWVGCSGIENSELSADAGKDWLEGHGYSISPVYLSQAERADYERFSGEVLWPLFHSQSSRCKLTLDCWSGYCRVNGRIAEEVQRVGRKAFVWVHDYQLMLVASLLRAHGWNWRIGYFQHIRFPPPSVFEALPWRVEILHALLQFDLIGFQTDRDLQNFVASLESCLPLVRPREAGGQVVVQVLNREVRLGTYPLGIDSESFSREAESPYIVTASNAIREYMRGTRTILSVDRLDYASGILEGMAAFRKLLDAYPETHERVTMTQIVIPSSESIPDHKELELQIEATVAQINEKFGRPSWTPIHYYRRQLTQAQLIAFYRSADVALVIPLKEGMNLVAKEFCACRTDNRGVLVLSEFAGAAKELNVGALLANPLDVSRTASMLHYALRMNESEQSERMFELRAQVRTHDVFAWSRAFRADALGLNLIPGGAGAAAYAISARSAGRRA
jgi:alpha,alpha-trehalose-phosphate synthase [UDP-forming]